jgi:putative radical SAM enzyme (TIGR03279 family)
MIRVSRVLPGSIAAELGLVPGAELLSVNGQELADFLDWEFLAAEPELSVEARLPDGSDVVYEIERDEAEPIGLELEPPTIRRCANRCEFCFIEGLPRGLRKSLYVRDDDYRLSFAYGNFATLSNLKDRDFERILRYRLSPLYISVHATPWEARKRLLNNPRVPNIVEQLSRLAAGGIQFHCQMVVVPGLNDGAVLEQSLTDLWAFGAAVLSVALVPVGLTQFSHIYTGTPMSRDHAARLLDAAERWGVRARRERGDTWVYGSDELYLLAGRELPRAEFYGDFAQIENGVGAVAALHQRVRAGLHALPRLDGARIGVVTGASMSPIMPELLALLGGATGAEFVLLPAENSLFGPTVTTAGLLVSADVRRALSASRDLDAALIPAESLNDGGLFLDDVPFDSLRAELPTPVHPSYDFVDVLSRARSLGLAAGAVRA